MSPCQKLSGRRTSEITHTFCPCSKIIGEASPGPAGRPSPFLPAGALPDGGGQLTNTSDTKELTHCVLPSCRVPDLVWAVTEFKTACLTSCGSPQGGTCRLPGQTQGPLPGTTRTGDTQNTPGNKTPYLVGFFKISVTPVHSVLSVTFEATLGRGASKEIYLKC